MFQNVNHGRGQFFFGPGQDVKLPVLFVPVSRQAESVITMLLFARPMIYTDRQPTLTSKRSAGLSRWPGSLKTVAGSAPPSGASPTLVKARLDTNHI